MATVVMKFGGSSVADAGKIRRCAQHAIDARRRGDVPVVVVSAMGDSTDDLIDLARTVAVGADAPGPDKRELDQMLATGEQVAIAMMAMTLRAAGLPAQSLTGGQAGILTDAVHGRATITSVDTRRLRGVLGDGQIPVVAGFQGVSPAGDITTLGRGGSDTTAVTLAAALGAGNQADDEPVWCEIYKDVDGVFTADPRLAPEARRRHVVRYDEMLEAAALGSQVIHPRAVELAKRYAVPVRILHSQEPGPGTWVVGPGGQGEGARGRRNVMAQADAGSGGAGLAAAGGPRWLVPVVESRVVSGVVLKKNVGRVSLRGVANRAGVQAEVFLPLAKAHLPVDDIIQEDDGPGTINLTFTMDREDLREATALVQRAAGSLGAQAVRIDAGLCTVSAVGAGMRTTPGVAGTMFKALADAGIVVQNITTSEIRISCVLDERDGPTAVRRIHAAFGLESDDGEAAALAAMAALAVREVKPASLESAEQ